MAHVAWVIISSVPTCSFGPARRLSPVYAKAPGWLLRREGADRRELQLVGISDTGVALS